MAADGGKRQLTAFEEEAEVLLAYQLDLLAHLESQLRATHQMLRQIEKLRNPKNRLGPELSNGQRGDALTHLDTELDNLENQVKTQRELCSNMHQTVDAMQVKLKSFRQGTERGRNDSSSET
jgi:predicted  nucleic acid-binding Zn-ribbon protein